MSWHTDFYHHTGSPIFSNKTRKRYTNQEGRNKTNKKIFSQMKRLFVSKNEKVNNNNKNSWN